MIETFIVDWPTLVLLGIVFGAFAPDGRWVISRVFLAGLASAAAFTLVAMLSYLVAPDWMWMYFLDPSEISWVVPLIAPGYLGTFVLGYAAALSLRRLGGGAVWGAAIAGGIANVIVIVATWDRYRFVGSTHEWMEGRASPLFSFAPSGEARTIGLLGIVFVVVLAASAFLVWRDRASAVRR